MNTNTQAVQPESYSTFWEPTPAPPSPQPAAPNSAATAELTDAYLEFTEVTEGAPAKRGDRT